MKSLLIDSTLCINCKACQVACKRWHNLPAENDLSMPPDLTGGKLTLVKDSTAEFNGRVHLLFFKDQCRHCIRPRCIPACPLKAIERDPSTGAIVITNNCKPNECVNKNGIHPCEEACVYNIPKFNEENNIERKCDLCYDRINDDSKRGTSCADACPTGAIYFGDEKDVRVKAITRLKEVKNEFPNATVYSGTSSRTRVLWILATKPELYKVK